MTTTRIEDDLRRFARVLVQAGFGSAQDQVAELSDAVHAELPHTDSLILARAWLAAAHQQWCADAAAWGLVTDHDRLLAAISECAAHDLPVLAGVDDIDEVRHHVAASPRAVRGVAWFSRQSVWDAVMEGVLRIDLRHPDGTVVGAGAPLAEAFTSCLRRHDIPARYVSGRVEAATHWRRRPG